MFKFLFNPFKKIHHFWRKITTLGNWLFSKGLNILFPPRCLGCQTYLISTSTNETNTNKVDKLNWPLCENCFKTIPINSGFFCPQCHRRLPEPKKICHPETKYILAAVSSYQNYIIKELIQALKYQNVKNAMGPLTALINIYITKISSSLPVLLQNSLIIPIPLHPSKERQRGFNQTYLIAQALAKILSENQSWEIKIETNNLIRIKNTVSQTKLENYQERIKNVANCFKINQPSSLRGKNIILVDDVSTSGATLKEAVTVLKKAGAKRILAFVIAKA